MAFMMPVMKNNYEIYPGKANANRRPRSRQSSSSSNGNNNGVAPSNNTLAQRSGHTRPASSAGRSASESDRSSGGNPSPCRFQYSSSAPSSGALLAAAAARPQRTVRFCRSVSTEERHPGGQPSGSRRSMTAPVPALAPGAVYRSSSVRSSSTSSSNSTSSGVNDDDSGSSVTGGSTGNVSDRVKSGLKFHSKLIEKLKRKFRMKDDVDVCSAEEDSEAHIRSST